MATDPILQPPDYFEEAATLARSQYTTIPDEAAFAPAPPFANLDRWCSACVDGSGIVQAPEWREWFRQFSNARSEAPPEPEGPEEIECGECDGAGRVLTEAGAALLAFLRRHKAVA